jgi:transcriptional regulator with XRE-family HTH domain
LQVNGAAPIRPTHHAAAKAPSPDAVVTKATLRAAERLAVPDAALARVLGVSASSVSRLRSGRAIRPSEKEGELALLFLRLYRSLDALLGGDAEGCRRWLRGANAHLGGVPLQLIQTVSGLVNVGRYLDAMRGKN